MASTSGRFGLTVFLLICCLNQMRCHDAIQQWQPQKDSVELEDVVADLVFGASPEGRHRYKRSVESDFTNGVACTVNVVADSIYTNPANGLPQQSPNNVDSCIFNGLPNTRCNVANGPGKCVCNPNVAVRFNAVPNAAICLPLAYVNNTKGQCIPSLPDMCSVQVSGSYCANTVTTTGARQLRCVCNGTGVWPNCLPQLGTPCQNDTVCRWHIPNSYCNNIQNGFGTCQCPVRGTIINTVDNNGAALPPITVAQSLLPNLARSQCLPQFCPSLIAAGTSIDTTFPQIDPCQGDNIDIAAGGGAPIVVLANLPYTCVNATTSYQCNCKVGSLGRTHTPSINGRCCTKGHYICADYSKCIPFTQLCDGVVDCADCSDEKSALCSGAWPSVPACSLPNRP